MTFILRGADRAHDIRITAASAEISRQVFTDLFVCRIRVLFKKRLDREDKARRAVAALRGPLLDERLLNWVKRPALTQSLYGDNLSSFYSCGQQETGANGPPVEQDRAGATGPDTAALPHAPEPELVPENVK